MNSLIVQMGKFFGISGIGWLMDFTIFTLLSSFGFNVVYSNFISSAVAVSFVFWFSSKKTFKEKKFGLGLKYKYIIYIIYQIILILVMSYIIKALSNFIFTSISIELIKNYAKIISKILVTPVTMVLNFIVMKNIIEKI